MTDVLRSCRRTWRRLGVERQLATELADELEADLAAAASDGVAPIDYVGGNPRGFATRWAEARAAVRPRLRIATSTAAAIVGGIPGASFGLFVAYGLSSPAIGEMIGSPVRVGERSYTETFTPPEWLLLCLYALAIAFVYAGAVAAVAAVLRWRLDPLARHTVRLLTAVLPIGAVAALGVTVLFSWSREFSTTPRIVIGDVLVATAVFAATVAAVRVAALARGRVPRPVQA